MTQEPSWQMIGQSVRGASHYRSGQPNQDALGCYPSTQSGPPLILAVSDGHGSAKSFRSDRGSLYAVTVATELMRELVEGRLPSTNLSAVKRVSEERLPQELVRRWQEAVDADLSAHPFGEEELRRLAEERGERSRDEVVKNPRLAYGATVLGVLVERDFILFLQLGDGDILTVSEQGEVVRPLARDQRLIANETTSLCMDRAWREIRMRFQVRHGGPPALILAATDGYANSFVNDTAFLKVGSDILAILCQEGAESVQDNLETWLREASEAGSGDDITLGILYQRHVVAAMKPEEAVVEQAASGGEDSATSKACAGVELPVRESGDVNVGTAGKADTVGSATSSPSQRHSRRNEALRSQMVAHLKHEGPSEPSKQGRLSDIVEDDAASVD